MYTITRLLLYFNENMYLGVVFYTLLNGHVLRSSACLSKQEDVPAPFQCADLKVAPSSGIDNAV